MRKLIALSFLIVTLLFTSCKKDYTCTCTYRYPGNPDEVTVASYHGTRGQAGTFCDNSAKAFQPFISTPGESYACHL